MDRGKPDLRLNNRERALADAICRVAFLNESDLCCIAVRKLLNLWDRTPNISCRVPGAIAQC